ncbi:MAG TPA: argininosuccinate lyase [Actinomycetota bacterium]|nr:argininosuccinate lyase [Actinomycetota bacterium]
MAKPLWSGRFSKDRGKELDLLGGSLSFDQRLWAEDIAATRAHAKGLERAGILSQEELASIEGALAEAADAFESGAFELDESHEDIHSVIEAFLTARLGATGGKIHAGRSRNDLVVTDLRLWLKKTIPSIARKIHELQEALYRLAREHQETLAPGYTHLQRAQPVLLSHLLLAHSFALARDFERVIGAYRRADVSSLGAAAFAGTSLPLDAKAVATDLGFSKVFDNSVDAVADRDFALEFLSACAILAVHLSRLGEEIVLWTSSEFGFLVLDDAYSTGSSIMPQKKNPDVGELVRAKSARVSGNLVHLLGVLKGLPLAYNRDLQEDKEPVFDSADSVRAALDALRGLFQTATFDKERLADAASSRGPLMTDLAEALVIRGVPFREAHEAVGEVVKTALQRGIEVAELSDDDLRAIHPEISARSISDLDPMSSVRSRRSHGGTAPERVAEQIARLESIMDDEERWLAGFGAY